MTEPMPMPDDDFLAAFLEKRLLGLSDEVEQLRQQQRQLALPDVHPGQRPWTRQTWVALPRHAGFSDEAMRLRHREFEHRDPDHPAQFLASLGFDRLEVASIRQRSCAGATTQAP